ncbi:MAG: lysophospholipid acyltransferase family protein [Candidatus Omnitrophica bacterium]|nr:lysophospholipid acyltransferase family protein [Candidatus Omnitrophota bacterium]
MIQYFLYKFCLFIIHCIPRPQAYRFGQFLADRHYRNSNRDRVAVENNLRQILGADTDVHEKAREVFLNFGRYLVDFFLMYKMVDSLFVADNVVVEGLHYLKEVEARGKGGIILTAHIGNWELGGAVSAKLGYPLTVIALPHKERKVNILFNKQREAHGVTVIPANTAVRRCIEALRQNKFIAVVGDRDFGTFGEPLPFLGRMTLMPKGAAFFSYRTGAPIIPSFMIPQEDGKYMMSYAAPIWPPEDSGGDGKDAIIALMKQCVAAIEAKIREYPTQWLMFREFGVEKEHLYPHSRA